MLVIGALLIGMVCLLVLIGILSWQDAGECEDGGEWPV